MTTSWVLALCLVVGAIALVAGATAPGRLHAGAAQLNNPGLGQGDQVVQPSHARHQGPHASPAHRTRSAAQDPPSQAVRHVSRAIAKPIVYTYHGTGSWFHALKLLSLVSASKWQLRWSYSCPVNQVAGSFAVTESGVAAAHTISINASGPGGQGTALLVPGGRTPHLAVTSSCPWTVKVVGLM